MNGACTVLCTLAVVAVIALGGCIAEFESCHYGPGWRSECTEKSSSAEVLRGPARAPSAPSALVDAAERQTGASTGFHSERSRS